MAKKDKIPWLLIAGFGAGLYWLFSSPASAQAATPATSAIGAAAKAYMSQLTAAQGAYLNGSQSLAQYQAAAKGLLIAAASDPAVSAAELANLNSVAGTAA